jgi:hypothetical protein
MRIILLVALAVLEISFTPPLRAAGSAGFVLNYIGQQIVPNQTRFKGTTVGGLSSLDYNAHTARYLSISDDRSRTNPARFYEISLDLAKFHRSAKPGMAGVTFHAVTMIEQPGGGTFEKNSVDPEALRFDHRRNKIYWSEEGRREVSGFRSPVVREMNVDGSHSRDFIVPVYYAPSGSRLWKSAGSKGVYDNLGFESLAISTDGSTLYTATENGLVQDSPPANAYRSSRARILAFDIVSGKPVAEYAYDVEPVTSAPSLLGSFAIIGVSDFLAIGDRQFITIERALNPGTITPGRINTGYTIRLYYADARNATNISGMESIAGKNIAPVKKVLLLDMSDLKNANGSALAIGNIEGITFGPEFNGKRTIVLVADNNFSRMQFTQFVTLEIASESEQVGTD